MKHLKMIGLLASCVLALMVFSGSASALVITSPAGTAYTGVIKGAAEGHVVLDNPIAKIECASSFEDTIESHGPGVTGTGTVKALSFTNCTNSWHVTVVSAGTWEGHYQPGTRKKKKSKKATVEATRFGISCRYATENTEIGEVVGSKDTGGTATLNIQAAIPFHSGSPLCGSGATTWTGSYSINTPDYLDFDE